MERYAALSPSVIFVFFLFFFAAPLGRQLGSESTFFSMKRNAAVIAAPEPSTAAVSHCSDAPYASTPATPTSLPAAWSFVTNLTYEPAQMSATFAPRPKSG